MVVLRRHAQASVIALVFAARPALTQGLELVAQNRAPGMATIDAWALDDSILVVARSPKPREMFAHADATIERWSLGTGTARLIGSGLYDVASVALGPRGEVAAGLMAATIWSRYTKAYEGGYWYWDVDAALVHTTTEIDARREAVSDVALSSAGKSLLAVTYFPIPTKRTCAYVACGEDESTDYNVWLTHIEPRTGKESRIVRLDQTNMAGSRVTLSSRGDRVLVQGHRSFRVVDAATGTRVTSIVVPAPTPDDGLNACGDVEAAPHDRFSASARFVFLARPAGGTVANARTGQIIRRVRLERDTLTSVLLDAEFVGDSAIGLLTCAKGVPGSALRLVDLNSGHSREIAHFNELVLGFRPLSDGSYLTHDGDVIRVYGHGGELRASLLFGLDGEWLVVAADGRYDASASGTALAAWRSGSTLLTVEQRPGAQRVPGLLRQLLTLK